MPAAPAPSPQPQTSTTTNTSIGDSKGSLLTAALFLLSVTPLAVVTFVDEAKSVHTLVPLVCQLVCFVVCVFIPAVHYARNDHLRANVGEEAERQWTGFANKICMK